MSEHTEHVCNPPCVDRHCQFCDGGLFLCTECNGFEGAMPTDCAMVAER